MLPAVIVFIGCGIGGTARHLLNGWVIRTAATQFPLGILLINVLGSSAMGVVAGWFAYRGRLPKK
jgi:CrcB protein